MAEYENPWDRITDLPKFDYWEFALIADAVKPFSNALRKLLKADKVMTPGGKGSQKKGRSWEQDDSEYKDILREARDAEEYDGPNLGSINYDTGQIEFEHVRSVYRTSEKEFDSVAPGMSLCDSFPMRLAPGTLTTDRLMTMLHNQEIQRKLMEFLGLRVPKVGEANIQHSILPGHTDENKSMGVRWSEDQSHLIARDFSNFYGDKFEQVDYNVTRLFAVTKYGNYVPRLRGPEFVTWTIRLMIEAGVLSIDSVVQDYTKYADHLLPSEKTVLDQFRLLDAIKRFHPNYRGETTFADKFSSAWCGLSPSTLRRVKKTLVEEGYIEITGECDCSGGKRKDGFFNTNLYAMVTKETTKEKKVRLEEAIDIRSTPATEKASKQVEDRYPDLGTLVTLTIDAKYYDTVVNFVTDIGCDPLNVPEIHNMGIPIVMSPKYETIEIDHTKVYFADQFVLDVVEGSSDPSLKVLVATCICPPINRLIDDIKTDHPDTMTEGEDVLGFVICSDIEDKDLDLDFLTIQFNEYLGGKASFSRVNLRYMDDDGMSAVLDGLYPISED